MPATFTSHFFQYDCGGRHIKLRPGKNLNQTERIIRTKKHHEINIMGHTGFAVKHGSDAAADKITDACLIQRPGKKRDQVRFWHGRIAREPRPPPVLWTRLDAGFE